VRLPDLLGFALHSLARQRFRSAMMLLCVAIGVSAVVMLVALGEGARGYVLGEFAFLGSDTLVMFPGRKTTSGAVPPISGAAARDITLEHVALLERQVPDIALAAPLVLGSVPVSAGSRTREAMVLGTNAAFFTVRRLTIAQGSALPALEAGLGAPVAVIGEKLKRELFDNRRALGQWVRLRDYRFRVVGVLAGSGDSFGMDLSEAIFVPVASAQSLFDVHGLFRVVFRLREGAPHERVQAALLARMRELHDGEEDVTLVSPDAMLGTFAGVLRVLTLGVSGIAAISLVVAGILVMNLTLLSVRQRTAEIGLLKALGATDRTVRGVFLAEAASLAAAGALAGTSLGSAGTLLLARLYPAIPFHVPAWALLAAAAAALGTALLFAWMPATRAARLEPVSALGRH
jgi:putative ABC transport system permease protein